MALTHGVGLVLPDEGHGPLGGIGPAAGGVMGMDMTMPAANGGAAGGMSPAGGVRAGRSEEERQLSQWGYHETKELIALRAELEKDFVATKNSKTMWEIIASQMKERGYRRSAAQCKCKWKVLVNRYKGKEIAEHGEKSFPPFYEELDTIFKERARNMDRLLLQSEGTAGAQGSGIPMQLKAKSLKRSRGRSEEENTDAEEEAEEAEKEDAEEELQLPSKRPRGRPAVQDRRSASSIQEVLEQFFVQQLKLEQEWREAMERRETERREREKEWRERMEALEKEQMGREAAWREAEEHRRAREEERGARRDQLIQALIAKLG